MLRSIKELLGYRVTASDGDIGALHDFLVDEPSRDVRYLVAETGTWLNQSHVLLARAAFGDIHWPIRAFPLRLAMEQVRRSPEITWGTPLTRDQEHRLHRHYEWLPYWLGEGWGTLPMDEPQTAAPPIPGAADPRLWHVRDLLGAIIRGTDLDLGHAHDMIVDDETWRLRSLVVNTGYWWPQSIVMIDMAQVVRFDAGTRALDIALSREQIARAPAYDEAAPVNRRHELVLYDYLGRPHHA